MTTPYIEVEGLSKKFSGSLKRAMAYGLLDIAKASLLPHRFRSDGLAARLTDEGKAQVPAPRPAPVLPSLRPTEFWALQDVSFSVGPGDCLGVVGHNGAGKSTLFCLLSGIYGPSAGAITVRGRLQALIALGAGFHPALTGRENIFINASVFGLSTREIEAIYDEIVDFAELEKFMDMPVKNYSSGMFVRLGFSVAVHLRPEVLLVDEVLSVGDLSFQNKSFRKIRGMIDSGIPVLFVSHYPQAIESVATQALWLDHGRVQALGETREVLDGFVESMQRKHLDAAPESGLPDDDTHPIRVTQVELFDMTGGAREEFRPGEPVLVRLHYTCDRELAHPYFMVQLRREGLLPGDFTRCSMADDGEEWNFSSGSGYVDCRIGGLTLCPGPYAVKCGIMRNRTGTTGQAMYQDLYTAARFIVAGQPEDIGLKGALRSTLACLPAVINEHQWSRPGV